MDSDLAAMLPEPPPPRPAQRESAIGAAMRRFDGHDDAPRSAPDATAEPPRRWRPQAMSLATMALVALVSTSVWLSQGERFVSPPPRTAGPDGTEISASAPPQAAMTTSEAARPVLAPAPADAIPGEQTTLASEPAAPSPPPPPGALGEAFRSQGTGPAENAIVVSGSRIERPDYESNSPVVAAEQQLNRLPQLVVSQDAAASSRDEADAAVAGRARAQRPPARTAPAAAAAPAAREAASPDWAACTVSDPSRNVSACRRLADPAERGARGRAAAQLADGLSLAWNGELDRAITTFSRAISTAPDLSLAYLNRGLTYQLKGDLGRAEADLDRAIDADPRAGRGYYYRSQVRRARGDAAGAEADANRAARLGRD